MIKVGITGQSGFIGTHLFNYLNLKKENIRTIPFKDSFFEDKHNLKEFVKNCDVIIHLAAMNRHGDPMVIYDTNLKLVKTLIDALEETESSPHVLFSSSTQEDRDNLYGKSKLDGRLLFEQWAERNNARFTGFVIPNVFGPFANPYYNSVVATFCHQLTHNEEPHIENDAKLKLIYVNELTDLFYRKVIEKSKNNVTRFEVAGTTEISVSGILELLVSYRKDYFENNNFPLLNSTFKINLFNTFRSYIDHSSFYPVILKKNSDNRGSFVETIRSLSEGQFSFSTTNPGITRGNHYHTRKIERFIVIKGRAVIRLRKVGANEVLEFELDGDNPSFVDMPVWYTHNITNTGHGEMVTLFWINEFYNQDDPDTYFEEV